MLPTGIAESNTLILAVDQCLLTGFTNLDISQQEGLHTLSRVFDGTPLGSKLNSSVDELVGGVFQPDAFAALAAARAALQGAQYDALSRQAREALGRSAGLLPPAAPGPAEQTPPLLDSVRHWLMDLAIAGFGRIDPSMVTPFFATLEQIRANRDYIRSAALLTGFVDELLSQPEAIPTFRWCDLWTRAMITTFASGYSSDVQSVSGTLYPLGILWRQHASLTSFVLYGVLDAGGTPELIQITQSAYKVEAISAEQVWLLFPEAERLLDSLSTGKTLLLHDMPYAPGGHLLWDASAATPGQSYKLMEIALAYFAPGTVRPIAISQLPPEQRHPIHLAEPIALASYRLGGDETSGWIIEAGDDTYKLDAHRTPGAEISIEATAEANQLFGLLRFDAGEWLLQPLALSSGKGKPVFIGKESSKILKKPPKDSTVSILKERASRLLREKA